MRLRSAIGRAVRELLEGAGLGEVELRERLSARGLSITVPMVRGFLAGRRLPHLEVLVEILRLCGAGFGDLEALIGGESERDLRGPVPPADAVHRIGWALAAIRLEAGYSRRELAMVMRGGRRAMNVEKLVRWESGELLPPILSVLWALQAMDRSLGELDHWIERFGAGYPLFDDDVGRP